MIGIIGFLCLWALWVGRERKEDCHPDLWLF